MKTKILLLAIFVFAFIIRLYKISEIPGEWYGDISNVHEYVTEILEGKWPFYFFQSPGPFYHYLITPIVLVFRNYGYDSYKFASIFVSLLGLSANFLFFKEVLGRRIALIGTLLTSLSLWFFIWSRLGNSQIVIPALFSLMSFFLFKYLKKLRLKNLIAAIFISSLGLYTYPQTFILPVFLFIFLSVYLVVVKKFSLLKSAFFPGVIAFLILAIPFALVVKNQPENFGSEGYVGKKILPILEQSPAEFAKQLTYNYAKTLLMLHIRGDVNFRVNIPNRPLIDPISGILFFPGFIYLIKKKKWPLLFYTAFGLLFLVTPSVSPAIPEIEIPNSARTITILPLTMLLVACGLIFLWRRIPRLIVILIFVCLAVINLQNYFNVYASGLPDNNLAPSRHLSKFIDEYFGQETAIYFPQCCWGRWGQPEPKGIAYSLRKKYKLVDYKKQIQNCTEIASYPALLVFHDKNKLTADFSSCLKDFEEFTVRNEAGIEAGKLLFIRR